MRSNTYARYTNPSKFMTAKVWAEEAIADGNRIRNLVTGHRVLEAFVPSTHERIRTGSDELGWVCGDCNEPCGGCKP